MRAMILAAGLGTRLRPLTDSTPKPLVPVAGRPMIAFALDWMEKHGISEVLINIHHHADQLEQFTQAERLRRPGLKLELQDERSLLLGSGGAIRRAAPWLFANDSAALVFNADSLMTPEFAKMSDCHRRLHKAHGVLCTLAVMPHPDAGQRYNAFSVKSEIIQEHVKADPHREGEFFHFPGLYMVERTAMDRLQSEPEVFCIVEKLWKPLIGEKKLGAWSYSGSYRDLGTVADLALAEEALKRGEFR